MQRVMLLNPKGGSGKTTLATTLASWFAANELATTLIDHDAQGSSTRWLRVRPSARPAIHGIEAYRNATGVTRAWQMRVPPGTDRVVVDTPAGFRPPQLVDLIREADCVLVPVLPSHIDIDAVSGFLAELERLQPVRDGNTRVAVVANRVRRRTSVFDDLEAFLQRVGFPFVGRLRESQRYLRAAERGVGVLEIPGTGASADVEQWTPLLAWVAGDLDARVPPLPEPQRGATQSPLFSVS